MAFQFFRVFSEFRFFGIFLSFFRACSVCARRAGACARRAPPRNCACCGAHCRGGFEPSTAVFPEPHCGKGEAWAAVAAIFSCVTCANVLRHCKAEKKGQGQCEGCEACVGRVAPEGRGAYTEASFIYSSVQTGRGEGGGHCRARRARQRVSSVANGPRPHASACVRATIAGRRALARRPLRVGLAGFVSLGSTARWAASGLRKARRPRFAGRARKRERRLELPLRRATTTQLRPVGCLR